MTDAAPAPGSPPAAAGAAPAAPGAGAAPSAGGSPAGAAAPAAPANGAPANGASPEWFAGLGLDPAGAQLIKNNGYKNANELTKAHHNLQQMIGAKGAILPGETASDEDWGKFYDSLGRPKSPDEYKLAPPREGYQPTERDKAYEAAMRPAFHKAGLTQRQIDTILGAHNAAYGEVLKDLETAQADAAKAGEAEIEGLKKQWGAAATKNIALAQQTAQSLIPKDSPLYDKLDKLLGSGPFVDFMYRVGTQFSESGGVLKANGAGAGHAQTKEQALVEIAQMEGNKDTQAILQDKTHPEYAVLTQKRARLYATAYPEPAK